MARATTEILRDVKRTIDGIIEGLGAEPFCGTGCHQCPLNEFQGFIIPTSGGRPVTIDVAVNINLCDFFKKFSEWKDCPDCKRDRDNYFPGSCPTCKGTGSVSAEKFHLYRCKKKKEKNKKS